jgi:hypothetical protein
MSSPTGHTAAPICAVSGGVQPGGVLVGGKYWLKINAAITGGGLRNAKSYPSV